MVDHLDRQACSVQGARANENCWRTDDKEAEENMRLYTLPAMPLLLMASLACRALLALIARTCVLSTPNNLVALLPTNWVTSCTSSFVSKMSTLLTMKTTFLPHCLMYLKNVVSLSVNGRSAEIKGAWVRSCNLDSALFAPSVSIICKMNAVT